MLTYWYQIWWSYYCALACESNQLQNIDFNKFVSNLDVKVFLEDNTILPYNCACSDFIDKDHQHKMTGDLRIVGKNKLRKLFTMGPKYWATSNISSVNLEERQIRW